MSEKTGLLSGLKVLDLSLWQPGHTATQLLADLGADVIKIEPPGGDRERVMKDRVRSYYRLKRSLVLNLKKEEDRARLLELVAEAEVVVEGFRPGVAERLGVGYEQLRAVNPALVYCAITGFGQTGPLANSTGHEHNFQAYAGAYAIPADGSTPVPGRVLAGNQGAGTTAAFAILAAVLHARATGDGEFIDVAMADVIASWVAPSGPIDDQGGHGDLSGNPGMSLYRTADGGHVIVGIFTEDHFWAALCRALDLPDLAELDFRQRQDRASELRAVLGERIAERSRDELVAELDPLGIPVSPILPRTEALDHPHFIARGIINRAPDGMRRVGHPVHYRHHPARNDGTPPEIDEGGASGFSAKG